MTTRPSHINRRRVFRIFALACAVSGVVFLARCGFGPPIRVRDPKLSPIKAHLEHAYRAITDEEFDVTLLYPNSSNSHLMLRGPGIRNLDPLEGEALERLRLDACSVSDLSPLQRMPLKQLLIYSCSNLTDLSPLAGMPLEVLHIVSTPVADLRPLKSRPLSLLTMIDTKVSDITVLQAMPLRHLTIHNAKISDLGPLAGLPLEHLDLSGCSEITDLSPLQGARLKSLLIPNTGITDLNPLQGVVLEYLYFHPGKITSGMNSLRNMPSLKRIDYGAWKRGMLGCSPDEFWRKYDSGEFR